MTEQQNIAWKERENLSRKSKEILQLKLRFMRDEH